jgi:lipopolysaccharide transport system ATP-binding protein
MPIAIHAENLGKRYRLGPRLQYKTLRDTLMSLGRRAETETIWALQDVSFDIHEGEVVGIIGRNGAGKSTLLKLLARITEPTAGLADVHGRIGSLLEVGTGFHPELTGRENIYLNGAILGMRRAEITSKFDEIVAFAETEKFLDTPVKHYSSGMRVRLAFAVAAHLQPEILLVDEVLAVGDVAFHKKCIGRMESVAAEGRTVLVVSHSMSLIQSLCPTAMLLEHGSLVAFGPASQVVTRYLSSQQADAADKVITDADHAGGVRQLRIQRIRLVNGIAGQFAVHWRQPIEIELELAVHQPVSQVAFGAGIRTIDGQPILTVQHDDEGQHPLWDFAPGSYHIKFTLANSLRPGLHKLHIGADQSHVRLKNLCAVDAVTLEVLDHTATGQICSASNSGLVNGSAVWQIPQPVVPQNPP